MRAEVMRLAKVVNDGDKCMILDCRGFHDPDKSESAGRWHLGMHPKNLQAIVAHPDFEGFLRDVRQLLAKLDFESEEPVPVTIVCYCRKGAHRSTAMAVILQHVLRQTRHVLPIRHLSKEADVWRQDYCDECRECRQFSFQKRAPHNNAMI